MTTERDRLSQSRPGRTIRRISDQERGRRYALAVELAGQGLDAATIAEQVGLSIRQVEEHLKYQQRRKTLAKGKGQS